MRPSVLICPMVVSGTMRAEIGLFLAHALDWRARRPDLVGDVGLRPIAYTVPAPCARNSAVKIARQEGRDVLVMIDADMGPSFNPVPGGLQSFLERAVDFLSAHKGPAAVGSPYCAGPPTEHVLAFEYVTLESGTDPLYWSVEKVRREDAARRKGIERVANIGTGLIAYSMDCFDRVKPPYFAYQYTDEFQTAVKETEDCWCHRRLAAAGVPVYCDWDCWSTHWKDKGVGKPAVISQEDVRGFYDAQAEGAESSRRALRAGSVTYTRPVPPEMAELCVRSTSDRVRKGDESCP